MTDKPDTPDPSDEPASSDSPAPDASKTAASGEAAEPIDKAAAEAALAEFEAAEQKADEDKAETRQTEGQSEASGAKADDKPARAAKAPRRGLHLREDPSLAVRALLGVAAIATVFGLWAWGASGSDTNYLIPKPGEVLSSFGPLLDERDLVRNILISLKRVFLGFGLAVVIAVPLGIVAASFRVVNAFLFPIITFFRNTPMATLVPVTMVFFSLSEKQKIMFIFIATFAFVLTDTVASVMTIPERYVETAQTVGATRRQIILKVLTPLALPDITTSVRFLFGLGFGYIILAEMLDLSSGGLGAMIIVSQHKSRYADMYMIVFVIVLMAFLIDRLLHFFQKGVFPYRQDL